VQRDAGPRDEHVLAPEARGAAELHAVAVDEDGARRRALAPAGVVASACRSRRRCRTWRRRACCRRSRPRAAISSSRSRGSPPTAPRAACRARRR
jgi:hypothetical protein